MIHTQTCDTKIKKNNDKVDKNPYPVRWGTEAEKKQIERRNVNFYLAKGHDYDPYK